MLGGKTYPFWSMQQNKQARLFNVGEHPRMQFHVHWVQVLDSNLRSIHERIPAPSLSPPPPHKTITETKCWAGQLLKNWTIKK